jgi:hypothetical protein
VQLEDKVVEDRDAAHEEALQREDVEAHGEDRLPEPVTEALHDAALEHRGKLLGAIRMILDRQRIAVGEFHMPQRESLALEALQVAVQGKSSDLDQFVYASDRRDLLERALGVLQPNLTRADERTARELHVQFADLSERVAELRHELTELEDSQDELLESHQKEALETSTAPDDKPKPTPGAARPVDPDAPRPPTTLTGPELAPEPAAPTTLTGPELPPERPAPTTLTGPELAPEPAAPSTLTGPELAPEPAAPSTLTGPGLDDLPPEPAAPSTLGDDAAASATPGTATPGTATPGTAADDAAAKARQPWWRRPFG